MSDEVIYDVNDGVALISMNRPDALNGLTRSVCEALLLAFERARNDAEVRAVVLTGEGRCFSTGADLKEGMSDTRTMHGVVQYEHRPVLREIGEIPKPVIAAVPGFAAGVGMSYALQSDLLVMADDAFLLSPFTSISLVPDGGACWLLVRQLGYRLAYQLSIESERISAERCLQFGLANKIVPAAEVRETALNWARKLCERAPLSLAATKKAMRHAMDNDWSSSYDLEAEMQGELGASADCREGVSAFFEKRQPVFKGK